MSSDWKIFQASQVCGKHKSAMSTGPFGSAISSRFFVNNGVPVIRGGNLSQDVGTRLNHEDLVFITEDKAREFERSTVKHGDLIFTCWGTIDQVGLVDERSHYEEYVISNKQMKMTPDPVITDSRFLYYQFSSPKIRSWIIDNGIGSSVPGFNLGMLKSIELNIPPLPEQQAIAHILGTLDDKIELNRKTNETLEEIAKALFKSWFVDFDPVMAKAEGRLTGLPAEISDLFPDSFEDSELGEIPSGWRVMELGMVSTFLNGYAFKSSDWQEHGVPVVKIGSVKPGFVDVDNVSFVSDEIAVSKDRYRLSPGDILIGMTGYVGEVGLVPISESLPLLNQRVGRVAPMSDAIVSRSFLYNWMRTSTFKDSVEVLSHGSAQANVSSDSIQSIPHAIPSSDIERAFAFICEPILDRLLEGHREQKLLANIRDALLPKLISGEIRIPDAEKMLEEVDI